MPKAVEFAYSDFIIRHDDFQRAPKAPRVIMLDYVACLVGDDVIDQRHRRHDKAPIQSNAAASIATNTETTTMGSIRVPDIFAGAAPTLVGFFHGGRSWP